MENANKIDFLAIGDIVIDAFILLEDANLYCDMDKNACKLCLRFGDKIPYESVTVLSAVGNSPNAAVCASRLGLKTALVSNVGDDRNGKDCIETLEKEKILTDFVTSEKDKPTNYHYVLSYEVDRTILIKHTLFDYQFPKDLPEASWVYLSSLAENSLPYHTEIFEYLKKYPETKLALQPGTFQIKLGAEKLKELYERAEIFFSNLEEAQKILGENSKDLLILSKGIQALGPKIVVISDGENGAYMYYNDELYFCPIYPDIAPPRERTGAGDAFSSTITCAIASGKTPLEAFSWGPINSMSVIQQVGAQAGLLTKEQIKDYTDKAPESYKIIKIKS